MKLKINDLTLIMSGTDKEIRAIKKFVTYKDTSACMSGGSWHAERAKDVCLGKSIREYFVVFAGLTKEILIFCKENGIKIEGFEDNRTHFDFQEKDWTHDELREFFPKEFNYVEHQIRALQAMIKTNTGVVKAATSAGKSLIMTAFMKLTKLPTLILTDRATLGSQLAEDFRKAGIDCGFCSGKGVREGYCMVSTIQSVKKIGDLDRFKCVLSDEAHKNSSKTFQEFYKQFGCPLKYGFTASPFNGDYLDYAKIRQFLGSILIEIKSDELIAAGVMAKPHVYLVKSVCEKEEDYFDFNSAYDLGIVHNKRRNQKILDITSKYDRGVAILITRIEHGKELEAAIPGSIFISGDMDVDERRKILKQFNDGEIKVVIGSSVLNEGISVTNMFCLIQAAGQKARTQTIQRIGRCLRSSAEKHDADFYDFIDEGKFISKHSSQRVALYKKEGLLSDVHILDENLEEIKKLDKKK